MNAIINRSFPWATRVCAVLGLGACLAGNSALADEVRLHPLEHYCVTFELGGMMTGKWVECSRKHGNERYELQNTQIKVGPFTQSDNKRVVYVGPKIYSIPEKGPATVAENPMYEGMVTNMKDTDPMTVSADLMSGMGFNPTGETMDILDHTCNVAAGQMGRICMTDNGLVLFMDTMGQTRTAVAIDLDNGGDDDNYAIPDNVQEAPDLSKIMESLGGGY